VPFRLAPMMFSTTGTIDLAVCRPAFDPRHRSRQRPSTGNSPLDRLTIEIVLCPPLSGAASFLLCRDPFSFLCFLSTVQASGTPRSKRWAPGLATILRFDDDRSYTVYETDGGFREGQRITEPIGRAGEGWKRDRRLKRDHGRAATR